MTRTLMVAAPGLLSDDEWEGLTLPQKERYLASLTDLQVRAQASIRAAASRQSVEAVLNAWVTMGYLSIERAAAALAVAANP